MKKIHIIVATGIALLIPRATLAHCPLCTAGAGAAAIGLAWLGVSQFPIGVFIGAFGIALGLWMARYFKKQYIPFQSWVIAVASYALTVFPILPRMQDVMSWFVAWGGPYGSMFHRVYLINLYVVGSIIGALIMVVSPFLSAWVTKKRHGHMVPYQGIAITFVLLAIVSVLGELFI